MFTDSHCHLNFPELVSQLPAIRQAMAEAQVTRALCICTTMEEFEGVHALALAHDNFWSTVGVHPDNEGVTEPSVQDLLDRAAPPCRRPPASFERPPRVPEPLPTDRLPVAWVLQTLS
eukprot:gene838-biopygen582